MQARNSTARNFQDQLLDRLRASGQMTTLYLRNRMSLRGRILEFDPYVLLLSPVEGGPPQMVYKSAVVSISGPRRPARRGQRGPGRSPGGSRPARGREERRSGIPAAAQARPEGPSQSAHP